MSKDLQEPNNPSNKNEEMDLIVLFNLIGNAFSRFFNFIGSIFKAIFSVFIYALKAIIVNIKIIVVVVLLAGILGFVLESYRKDLYSSQMVVRPYFDSKYQLITNINYYNALISGEDTETLSKLFDISVEDAEQIKSFEIEIGPETENDKVIQYDTFIKSIDSTRAQEYSYEEFVENRSIHSGDFFQITVEANKKDIFKSLEKGLNSSFTNTYSAKKMKKRDSLITIKKQTLRSSIKAVDSLQQVYIKVMEDEASSSNSKISLGEGLTFEKDNSKTKEYELLNLGLKLRGELSALEEQKVEEDVYFDTISGFQVTGNKVGKITQKYSLIFPVLAFILLCLFYLTGRVVNYAKNYEG
jgi:hypothetical protein